MENQVPILKPVVDSKLEEKIRKKQQERHEAFIRLKEENKIIIEDSNILKLDVDILLGKLKSRELSATKVLQTYIANAIEITEKFNCITEFIPQAKEWARALDAQLNCLGPLHGLPVAIKDDHNVEGMDTTLGYAKNLYKPAKESAVLVKVLLKLGAVPFAKTNIPQSLFSNGSDNPIFGTTYNCRNVNLAPGGSSSGSACLVAAGGAAFATGSDLGGSLRTPSHFHGICSMRPTTKRLSDKGIIQSLPKLVGQRSVPGVIARDAKTLALVWKAMTEDDIQNKFDPLAVPVPWNENLFSSNRSLKVGFFTSLSYFPAFEDTKKTVMAAKDAFEAMGHETFSFEMPDSYHYMKVIFDLLLADHGNYFKEIFEGEPISYCVADLVDEVRNARFFEPSTSGESERSKIVSQSGADVRTPADLWDLVYEKRKITEEILSQMEKAGIDIILSPAFPFPAVKLHDGYGLSGAAYTIIWSFVDFPAGVVPFGIESGLNVQNYDDQDDPMLKRAINAVSQSTGMPINVQIIAPPYKEELVLNAMIQLENFRKKN